MPAAGVREVEVGEQGLLLGLAATGLLSIQTVVPGLHGRSDHSILGWYAAALSGLRRPAVSSLATSMPCGFQARMRTVGIRAS
jgi:hypothetical protein